MSSDPGDSPAASGERHAKVDLTQTPPTTVGGILRRLGPGLVLAGSIVGSGELIATTITGAQAGFWLLWLIVVGCVIKVFVQVELGRYAITEGKTTLVAINEVPGPRIDLRAGGRSANGNWILWFWLLMFLASMGQLGGIVGGVGQALAISVPLTAEGDQYNREQDARVTHQVTLAEMRRIAPASAKLVSLEEERTALQSVREEDAALAMSLEADESSGGEDGEVVGEAVKKKAVSLLNKRTAKTDESLADLKTKLPEREQAAENGRSDLSEEQRETLDALIARAAELAPVVRQYQHKIESHAQLKTTQDKLNQYHDAVADDDLSERAAELRAEMADLQAEKVILAHRVRRTGPILAPSDDKYWAAIIGAVTAVLLVIGRYGFIERFVMIMVGSFTLVTILNVFALQLNDAWAIHWGDLVNGLSFQTPKLSVDQTLAGKRPIMTALATFGIIGVGASELVAYPYWCLEKGYARWTGKRDESTAWAERARGWLRVMRWDAWCSMFIYTIATVAFYLLGAAILHRVGLQPESRDMIRMLAVMYEPVFGAVAQVLFLFGAFAVLYSTFFVANAAQTRMATDVMDALGITRHTAARRRMWIRVFGVLFPAACVGIYSLGAEPVTLVLISGTMQALMLPMLGCAAIFFRYRRGDKRLRPGMIWDLMLWLSFVGFLMVALYRLSGVFFAG